MSKSSRLSNIPTTYGSGSIDGVSYAELRAYTGNETRLQLDDGYIVVRQGNAADNSGTIWKDALGRSWERQYDGAVKVEWFITGSTDNTQAIQNACNAGKHIFFGDSTHSYSVAGTVSVQSGSRLEFAGAIISQTSDQTPIFDVVGKSDIAIEGGVFIGKTESVYINSPSSQAICIKAENSTNIKVHNNTFQNFWYSPLMVNRGGKSIVFTNNLVIGPGSSVLGVDVNRRNTTGCTIIGEGILVAFNDISGTSQGVIIGQGSKDIVVTGNIIHNITNEHGIYADTGLKRITINNNIIRNTGTHGTGLKVQCYDSFGVQTEGVEISNNIISDTGGDAILIDNTSSTPTLRTKSVVISGNNVSRAGAYGIDLRDVENAEVCGNIIDGAVTSGLAWGNCDEVKIIDNLVKNSLLSGLRDLSACSNIMVKGNTVKDCAQTSANSDRYGLLINDGGTNYIIDGNFIDDSTGGMQYGIFIIPDMNQTLSMINNTVMRSSECGLRLLFTTPMRVFMNNNFNGTSSETYNDPSIPVVQSQATIKLPQTSNVVSIGNTINITSIVANGHSGRTVTLIFQGALTVVRGNNILLKQSLGNFNTGSGSTLTLTCDGVYWYEVSR